MTIVIQNRYWDLSVSEDRFEVGLSFNQVPAKLSIPYAAVTSFVDPAVNFALQFQVQDAELDLDESETAENDGLPPASPPDDGSNVVANARSEEHTSELQSLIRLSYAVFCLKKTN